jgi:transcriptional regulator with XRE-family HTH domain
MGTATGVVLPAGFWEEPQVRDALDRRDIGALLSRILEASGVTQHKLAGAIGCSQTQISLWVNNRHKPSLGVTQRIITALEAPATARVRLGLAADPGTLESPSSEVKLYRVINLAELVGRTGDTSQLKLWRQVAASGNKTAPWERLVKVIAEDERRPGSITQRMVDCTRGFYILSAHLPVRLVNKALTRHARDIGLLLEGRTNGPQQRRELMVIAGETSYLAACCNVDLGDESGAMRQLDLMEIAAREADDRPLGAMALEGRSHFFGSRQQHRRALSCIEKAREMCAPEDSPGTAAYLWLRTAEVHVQLRQLSEAKAAWARADELYPDVRLDTDRNWVTLWAGPVSWESVRATIYAAVGRVHDAAEAADRVATALTGSEGKIDAIALVNAAHAQVICGLFSAGAATGLAALRAIRTSECAAALPRLGIVARVLDEHKDKTRGAKAFLNDYRQTCRQMTEETADRR